MKSLLALLVLPLLTSFTSAQEPTAIEVTGGKHDLTNVPVRVSLKAAIPTAHSGAMQVLEGGKVIATAQLVPGEDKSNAREAVFILPELKAGASRTFQIQLKGDTTKGGAMLTWVNTEPGKTDLVLKGKDGARPIVRYMHTKFDDSSKEKRDRSYKVFHHLWDPDGKRFVTNGGQTDPHTDPKKLTFPHHRGLMFAFNRITYNGSKKADTWHATGDAHQSHEKFLREVEGPVLASHKVLVDWHGEKKEIFAKEERQMTVWNVPGGTLIDVEIVLRSTGGKVRLDGDPQHAGFQFRASNDLVTQGKNKQTYYLRPDGKGKPGETRNWDPKTKAANTVDLPWKVLSFVLDDQRYSVAYIDHPDNPGEARHSERDYGRFGYYFEYDLTPKTPLHLKYRVWLQKGEMTADQVEALRASFVEPPQVVVK